MTDTDKLPWKKVSNGLGGSDIVTSDGKRVLHCAWDESDAVPVIMDLANALHAEREKVAAMLAEADWDLEHEPAHVEPGLHPSPRFGPRAPSVTGRLDAIERRLAAIEKAHNPTT